MESVEATLSNVEAKEMMSRCVEEIQTLRKVVDSLRPKADAYDNIAIILALLPKPSQGYGEDLVWRLQKRIKELSLVKE